MHAKAYVESDIVCEAEITAMVTEEKEDDGGQRMANSE
jgi:hypothetical protein